MDQIYGKEKFPSRRLADGGSVNFGNIGLSGQHTDTGSVNASE